MSCVLKPTSFRYSVVLSRWINMVMNQLSILEILKKIPLGWLLIREYNFLSHELLSVLDETWIYLIKINYFSYRWIYIFSVYDSKLMRSCTNITSFSLSEKACMVIWESSGFAISPKYRLLYIFITTALYHHHYKHGYNISNPNSFTFYLHISLILSYSISHLVLISFHRTNRS